jgi:hypothetical protein
LDEVEQEQEDDEKQRIHKLVPNIAKKAQAEGG